MSTPHGNHDWQPAAGEAGISEIGFRDVHDACHRWLLQRSPSYARDYAANSARANGWRERKTAATRTQDHESD